MLVAKQGHGEGKGAGARVREIERAREIRGGGGDESGKESSSVGEGGVVALQSEE
jgi:hypothetical protein